MTYLITPKRGTVDPTTLKPNPLSDKPQTYFIQVERAHNQVDGLRLQTYLIGYEFDYADLPACTATGGVGAGAGTKISLPQIPAVMRVVNGWVEVVDAFVNDAASQEIDGVYFNTDAMIADGNITAGTGITEFDAGAVPAKYAVPVAPIVYFTGADTKIYTAGKMRIFVEVISYFEV